MNITKNNTGKELELTVELSVEEMKPYIEKAAAEVSKEVKVEGFRPGHVPYDILKQQVGEMYIVQEAANIAVNKTAPKAIEEYITDEHVIGQPKVSLTKLAADNPVEYKIVFSLMPEITVGAYKDLGITQDTSDVADDEVNKVIDELRELRSSEQLVERPAQLGDKVALDIAMFLDTIPVEGGTSKGTAVILGKDYLIPGFDEKIVGAKAGDVREFTLTYPAEHYQKQLAGKNVEFRVTVQGVYERVMPEINDEFAARLGSKDVEDLKGRIRENAQQEKQSNAEQKAIIAILEKILSKTTFSHVPDTMVDSEVHNMIHELEHNVERQGGKFADYLQHIKKTPQDLENDLRPDAEKRVKTSLVISKIVKDEKIEVTAEELQKELDQRMAAYEQYPDLKKRAQTDEYKQYIHYNMLNQKALNALKEWNIK